MKNALVVVLLFLPLLAVADDLPYPIIFVHGLNSEHETWEESALDLLDDWGVGANPSFIPVAHFDLDHDQNTETAAMPADTAFAGWGLLDGTWYGDTLPVPADRRVFLVNFDAQYFNPDHENADKTDMMAAFKQGAALGAIIERVLDHTGCEKVILFGHSMGGLCIREYLQRQDANGDPLNWVDPDAEDGHRVARVVTICTPHSGSNAFGAFAARQIFEEDFGDDPERSLRTNLASEAVRDLRHNTWSFDGAIYIEGGNEADADPWGDVGEYWNKDVNCNGELENDIEALSDGFTYNTNLELPENIPYTYIISNFDLIVDNDRAWLHIGNSATPSTADTLKTWGFHWDKTDDYTAILRGLDEPNDPTLAYTLRANRTDGQFYRGFSSHPSEYGGGGNGIDDDWYEFTSDVHGQGWVDLEPFIDLTVWELHVYDAETGVLQAGCTETTNPDYEDLLFPVEAGHRYRILVKTFPDLEDETFGKYRFALFTEAWPVLTGGLVWPSGGDIETDFEFTVTYSHPDNQAPNDGVAAIINGAEYSMAAQGNDWTAGVPFQLSLPASTFGIGSHSVYYSAMAGDMPLRYPGTGSISFEVADLGPDLVNAEWYVDTDPGFGNGHPIPVTPAQVLQLDTVLPLGMLDLMPGVHTAYIRAANAEGEWSLPYAHTFALMAISPIDPLPSLASAEYYVDVDPGVGEGLTIPLSGTTDQLLIHVDVDNLDPGVHTLGLRAVDEAGHWSLPHTHHFAVMPVAGGPPVQLTYAEYWYDTDPGQGNGISIPVSGYEQDISAVFTLADLPLGVHTLFMRVEDENGVWSLPYAHTFAAMPTVQYEPPANVEAIEFRLTNETLNETVVTNTLPMQNLGPQQIVDYIWEAVGEYRVGEDWQLVVRSMDERGLWSLPFTHEFEIVPEDDLLTFHTVAPASGRTTHRDGTVRWTAVQHPGATYRIEVSPTPSFHSVATLTTADTAVTAETLRAMVDQACPVAEIYTPVSLDSRPSQPVAHLPRTGDRNAHPPAHPSARTADPSAAAMTMARSELSTAIPLTAVGGPRSDGADLSARQTASAARGTTVSSADLGVSDSRDLSAHLQDATALKEADRSSRDSRHVRPHPVRNDAESMDDAPRPDRPARGKGDMDRNPVEPALLTDPADGFWWRVTAVTASGEWRRADDLDTGRRIVPDPEPAITLHDVTRLGDRLQVTWRSDSTIHSEDWSYEVRVGTEQPGGEPWMLASGMKDDGVITHADLPRDARVLVNAVDEFGCVRLTSDTLAITRIADAASISAAEPVSPALPERYELSEGYPNPFNAAAVFKLALPAAAQVEATVYNITGQEVMRLAEGRMDAGYHVLLLRADNLASGSYFLRVLAGDHLNDVRRVTLVR